MKQILRESKLKSSHKKSKTEKENELPVNDMPILSDSLLKRIQTRRETSNSVLVNQQNMTLLPIIPTFPSLNVRQSSNSDLRSNTANSLKSPLISNSFKLKTTSNIALSNSISQLSKQLNSAKYLSNKQAQHQLKKLNKTKFSALNNFQLNELTSSSSSFNSSGSAENQALLEDILDNGFNLNTKEKFNEKIQHNLNPQSSLLRKLRMNENENTNKTEIFVRPIAVKTKTAEDKGSKNKVQPLNLNLAPLIRNFRLNSFDINKLNNNSINTNKTNELFMQIPTNSIEFSIENSKAKSFDFNFKPFKPYQETNMKSKPSSPILANFEVTAHPNTSLKPIDQNLLNNKSINYLANGLFDSNNSNSSTPNIFAFKSSSYVSLNRKLDLDDIEYYDFNELFTNTNPTYFKSDNQRKKLSQINEESTVANTPMSDSRWSSSLSTTSDYNQRMDSNSMDEANKEELWSANNSSNSAHTSNTNQYGRPVRRNSRPILSLT